MELTGRPIIILTGLAALTAGTLTVLLWHRAGRLRIPVRAVSVLATEALVVFAAGLVVNRHEQFYPSWAALAGRTGTVAISEPRAGRLDGTFADGRGRSWQPPGSEAWALPAPATVTVPTGYAGHRGLSYPALVTLGGPATAPLVPAITVAITPGPRTADLPALPTLLAADLRTSPSGWALVTAAADLPLAERLAAEFPGRFAALAVAGPARTPGSLPIPVHVATGWAAAAAWASAQTPAALAPPRVLPS